MAILKSTLAAFATATLFTVATSVASAQTSDPPPSTPDVYRVSYFLGAQQSPPDDPPPANNARITILDPGSNGTGPLCAMIYVLNPSEELEECCGAELTPDEIRTGDIKTYLLANPLNGAPENNGVIKVVSAAPNGGPGGCDPGAAYTPTPTLREWITRVDDTVVGGVAHVTTTEFSYAPLSTAELTGSPNGLQTRCGEIENPELGSGYGICTVPPEPTAFQTE